MDLKKFGEYFAFIRKQEGYRSQRDLADKSGISNATISRIESGSNRVTPEVLRDLADCFNHVTYEQLMMSAGYLNLETVVDEISVSDFKRKLASQYDEVVEETKFCKFYTRGKKLKETLGKRNILIQSIADNLNFSMIDMNDILNENLKIDIQDAIKISKFYRLTFSEYFRIQIDFVITNDKTDEESLLYKIESLINKEIEEIERKRIFEEVAATISKENFNNDILEPFKEEFDNLSSDEYEFLFEQLAIYRRFKLKR